MTPGKKLLVVDDEADIRECTESFFRKRGVEVLVAQSGEEALKIAETENVDLILLDVAMGEVSGIEVCFEKNGKKICNVTQSF